MLATQACGMLAWMSGDLGFQRAAQNHAWTAWVCAEQADHNGARAWVRATQAKLARLLCGLHGFPAAAVQVPKTNPLGSLRADLRGTDAVTPAQREWLLARAAELERQYAGARAFQVTLLSAA